jgi:hypothetical protein
MKESELGEDEEFNDGDIVDINKCLENDSICQFNLVHEDHVYCVA